MTRAFRPLVAASCLAALFAVPLAGAGTPTGSPARPSGRPSLSELQARNARIEALAAAAEPTGLAIETSFVSSVGWVKPGEKYPFRVIIRNYGPSAADGGTVALSAVDGMVFTEAEPAASTVRSDTQITWTVGSVAAATETDAGEKLPGIVTLVAEGQADSTTEDPEIIWKDLSVTATMTAPSLTASSTSHGPKVIPPGEAYETARYGDRPFPVVPVEYVDLTRRGDHSADLLDGVINSPDVPGSTFNLYQEMSLKQLYPAAGIPSVGIETADFEHEFTNPKYADGFQFTTPRVPPAQTCLYPGPDTTFGATPDVIGTPLYEQRIAEGWYQLPGTVGYYGRDANGTALAGQVQPSLQQIDSGCGESGKIVYDAAHIADPEIDYSDYDTDKDGVVDFFMLIFAGRGGHGDSQIPNPDCDVETQPLDCPSYDNIWPHSSSLEFGFTDEETGLTGYISDDQLKDLRGRPLFYTDVSRGSMTTDETEWPVYVRVGPYNVNPESAIDKASVISHEYGHSLGLPDYYTIGDRETYGDWSLMATDKSQHIDVIGKRELGWTIPQDVTTGTVTGWKDSKVDNHTIRWKTADGADYTLSGPNVHNSTSYEKYLPGRQLIDPSKVADGASPSHVWWSTSGNDFGCPPEKGRNLDIALGELKDVDPGTPITVTFNSYWDIEWDFDYGFVLIGSNDDLGSVTAYTSVPSANGYTTASTVNPNNNSCLTRYSNGLTGTSGSYEAGTTEPDRRGLSSAVPGGTDYPDGPFLPDQYDISDLAGKEGAVLRFAYATDPGLARPGWFIDDLKITVGTGADERVIFSSDFEGEGGPSDPRMFPGGCKDSIRVSKNCTKGWSYVEAGVGSPAEHAYLLEMRDRSGFDEDGKGQNDRAAIGFAPGLLLTYTDEAHGYGNVGTDDPPAQSPLDANPVPADQTPALNDAAFSEGSSFSDAGWVDNYEDPSSESENWEFHFSCLDFEVLAMTGDDIGPTAVGGEDTLQGNVRFKTTDQCAAFDYGYAGAASASAPVARAQAKPETAKVGQGVVFDGSQSFDAQQAASQLKYAWDFDGDGTDDATGQVVRHAFAKEGSYPVRLTVTDEDNQSDATTITVVVSNAAAPRPRPPVGPDTTPATGGSTVLALLGLVTLTGAVALRRLRTS
jgi:M6 family metalloprotease-like protein